MANPKYPIGTKIRFLWAVWDTNKVGTIVDIDKHDNTPIIHLPTGVKKHYLEDGRVYTWRCGWNEIELVGQQQLLFDFMYK